MADQLQKDDLAKMKVAELKKELKERGLSTTGAKSELLERLTTALSSADSETLLAPDESIDLNNSNVVAEEVKEETKKADPEEKIASPTTVTTEEKEEHQAVKVSLSPTTESDRLKKRAERFGVVNEDIKKQVRAERFGIQSDGAGKLSTAGTGTNVDILKKRAERFGQVVSSNLSKEDEAERIRKRKERFGDVTSSANNTPASNTPSKFAKITFNSSDDEKKKKRAERFGLV